MTTYDLALTGGTVVTARGTTNADVYVRDGVVAVLATPGARLAAEQRHDVSGRTVLPGVVDAHTHFRTWSKHCDTLPDLTRAAAHGGVTTLAAFVMGMNTPGLDLLGRLAACRQEGEGTSPIDFGFHAAIADEPDTIAQIPEAMAQGVSAFKMFLINRARKMMVEDDFVMAAMRQIARHGGLAMVHAELEGVVGALSDVASGEPDEIARFAASRPAWVEAEATRRALVMAAATECPLYVVHVTCEQALDAICEARARGQQVFAETCPQYLSLTMADQRHQRGLAKVAPPLRTDSDRHALTRAVLDGDIDVVSSDHAPYEHAVKTDPATPFGQIPVGMPGTETLLGVTWKAVSEAGGGVETLCRVLASSPAVVFGLPAKGHVEVGADADFTVVDLAGTSTVSGSETHGNAGYSCYDGWQVPLRVDATYLRGHQVLAEGKLSDECRGTYLSTRPRQVR